MVNTIGEIQYQFEGMMCSGEYSYGELLNRFADELMHPKHNEFFKDAPLKVRFDWLYHINDNNSFEKYDGDKRKLYNCMNNEEKEIVKNKILENYSIKFFKHITEDFYYHSYTFGDIVFISPKREIKFVQK